ncbi:pilin [Dokdonella sp.]|uniref:pilin n=1 Tax=Dokdonella sp. TaxID=2291710 RepID=UPI003784852D
MNKIQKGFTLIELMIVVAIIAILAAIALPAYQDYMVRAKLSEVVVAGDACKNSIVEFYEGQGHVPPNISSAGCNNNTTKYIASTKVTGATNVGVITITTTGVADLYTAGGKAYVLKSAPSAGTTDVLEWSCNAAAGTTIPAKYVPSLCR